MRGIKIENGITENVSITETPIFVHESLEERHSDFSVFFKPLLEHANYNWALRNSPDLWQLPWEWFDEEDDQNVCGKPGSKIYEIYNSGYTIRLPEDGKLPNGYQCGDQIIREYTFAGIYTHEFVKKNAIYIKDDWNDLFTIAPSSQNTEEILDFVLEEKKYTAGEAQDIIERNFEWYFCNFDGLFWQFYSRSVDDLETIKSYLTKYKTVMIEDIPVFDVRMVNLKYFSPPPIPKETMEEITKIGDDIEQTILKMLDGLSDDQVSN